MEMKQISLKKKKKRRTPVPRSKNEIVAGMQWNTFILTFLNLSEEQNLQSRIKSYKHIDQNQTEVFLSKVKHSTDAIKISHRSRQLAAMSLFSVVSSC